VQQFGFGFYICNILERKECNIELKNANFAFQKNCIFSGNAVGTSKLANS
jgi:hypothetical protein